jgi:hypothetical protein
MQTLGYYSPDTRMHRGIFAWSRLVYPCYAHLYPYMPIYTHLYLTSTRSLTHISLEKAR